MGATTSLAFAKEAEEIEAERQDLPDRSIAGVAGAEGPLGGCLGTRTRVPLEERNDRLDLAQAAEDGVLVEDDPYERQRPRADLRGALFPDGSSAVPKLAAIRGKGGNPRTFVGLVTFPAG